MAENEAPRRAGLFDIRVIIGALIGLYGVILVITGFFTSDTQIEKSDGLNINLYAGIGMVVVSVAFVVWARVRPIVVVPKPSGDDEGADRPVH